MTIRTKRWNDPVEPNDGWRILITRFRPRGVSKTEEKWDEWMPQLGPSAELHAKVYGKTGTNLAWPAYRAAYLREMRQQQVRIAALAKRVAAGEMITLLCSSACERESRCHRSILKELILAQIKRRD